MSGRYTTKMGNVAKCNGLCTLTKYMHTSKVVNLKMYREGYYFCAKCEFSYRPEDLNEKDRSRHRNSLKKTCFCCGNYLRCTVKGRFGTLKKMELSMLKRY